MERPQRLSAHYCFSLQIKRRLASMTKGALFSLHNLWHTCSLIAFIDCCEFESNQTKNMRHVRKRPLKSPRLVKPNSIRVAFFWRPAFEIDTVAGPYIFMTDRSVIKSAGISWGQKIAREGEEMWLCQLVSKAKKRHREALAGSMTEPVFFLGWGEVNKTAIVIANGASVKGEAV